MMTSGSPLYSAVSSSGNQTDSTQDVHTHSPNGTQRYEPVPTTSGDGSSESTCPVVSQEDVFLSTSGTTTAGSFHVAQVPSTSADTSSQSTHSAVEEDTSAGTSGTGAGPFHFTIWRGIHLKSPVLMVGLLVLGAATAGGHHGYYTRLNSVRVGTESQQQWSLRFGSAFAHMTQIFLVASVGVAYTQWLWKTLIATDISVECLDSAFDADTAIISLLNKELVQKIKVGAFLALICWCLQLPSLITPATLTVLPTLRNSTEDYNVTSLDMYSGIQAKRFSVSVNVTGNTQSIFLGPRTVVSRLATATATLGIVLPIIPPFNNSTYDVTFFAPVIKCSYANDTIREIIQSLQKEAFDGLKTNNNSVTPIANHYYGFVPNLKNFGNGSQHNGVEVVAKTRMQQQPIDASNEIWMVYDRYKSGQEHIIIPKERVSETVYTTCQLWNASYTANLVFQGAVQNVTILNMDYLNLVSYPEKVSPNTPVSMVQHAYSAVMLAISDLLVGQMVLFNTTDPSYNQTQFGEIKTQIAYTSLIGSSDLRVHFDRNRELSTPNATASDQTKEDMNFAKNKTLITLIEELSVNVVMSFMNSQLLSPNTTEPAKVFVQRSINTYSYSSRNLFLAYGLALLFAVIANLLGAFAFLENKASYSRTFSAKVLTRKGKKLQGVVGNDETVLKAPHSDKLLKMRVKFNAETWGFDIAKPVVKVPEEQTGNRIRKKSVVALELQQLALDRARI